MKKTFLLLAIVAVLVGCNKKTWEEDIQGTWEVYKYTLNNADKTSMYKDYTIIFSSGKFMEQVQGIDTIITTGTGPYRFEDKGNRLVLTDSIVELIDTIWVSRTAQREYNVFNLTSVHVQLRTDSSELYMSKKEQEQ